MVFESEFIWPPSINNYWRRNGSKYFICKKGREFRQHVKQVCINNHIVFDKEDKLSIAVLAFPPDKRRRDLDNILKAIMDSLEKAGVYHDDNQIDQLTIKRMSQKSNKVYVEIRKIN